MTGQGAAAQTSTMRFGRSRCFYPIKPKRFRYLWTVTNPEAPKVTALPSLEPASRYGLPGAVFNIYGHEVQSK